MFVVINVAERNFFLEILMLPITISRTLCSEESSNLTHPNKNEKVSLQLP